ncbi:uncharacterized protein LOC134209850 [Armigeres subalbatus]|uniref:uncharacterized protein LOC134209850 n=1 Tax=Armigeres subalbatus TaxID=124917 RepID=UPI002ED3029B
MFLHRTTVIESLLDLSRFSNWNRLLRTTAYVFRAVAIFHNQRTTSGHYRVLQKEEFAKAEAAIMRQIQAEAFPDEVALLSSSAEKQIVSKSSPIYTLTPFLDDEGVIRIGSRTEKASNLAYEAKYPVILPKNHTGTTLLVNSFHRKYLHANGETVLNEIRQRYYIPGLRTVIRRVTRECQLCKVKKAVPRPPMMAPLPSVRLTPFIRPYTFLGVDYFGPLEVNLGRGVAKRWVALFTCLTIRAVHLEVVHSLSTVSCVMAFRRFVARRGAPVEVYSDNATNFVGASRQLIEEIRGINKDCAATFTNAHTTWRFNVPAAPHMGGPWERMVRSVKTGMKAITESTRHPNDETLQTVLLEVESVVNTRPLTYIPLDSAEHEALTPNHFLLYGSNGIKQPASEPVDSGSAFAE